MSTKVLMPRLTHDMTHGVLVKWLKSEGDRVDVGEPLFQVETDKAISEVVSEEKGILSGVQFSEGNEIPIGTVIAFILSQGEELPDVEPVIISATSKQQSESILPKKKSETLGALDNTSTESRIYVSPIARRIAQTHQVDLRNLKGSGPRGRIVEEDVWAYLAKDMYTQTNHLESFEEVPFSLIPLTHSQKKVGQQMLQSVQTTPQFTLEVDIDISEAQTLRAELIGQSGQSISFTAFLTKIVAGALSTYPEMNSSLDGLYIRRYKEINIGVAMATPEGLMVPVVRKANSLSFLDIQRSLTEMRIQANKGQIENRFFGLSTFTISNLGMYGIDRFQAIINPPEAAILAVGKIRQMPWVINGNITTRPIVNLRLSVDHRILDGSNAAKFLVNIKDMLESPYILFARQEIIRSSFLGTMQKGNVDG